MRSLFWAYVLQLVLKRCINGAEFTLHQHHFQIKRHYSFNVQVYQLKRRSWKDLTFVSVALWEKGGPLMVLRRTYLRIPSRHTSGNKHKQLMSLFEKVFKYQSFTLFVYSENKDLLRLCTGKIWDSRLHQTFKILQVSPNVHQTFQVFFFDCS